MKAAEKHAVSFTRWSDSESVVCASCECPRVVTENITLGPAETPSVLKYSQFTVLNVTIFLP